MSRGITPLPEAAWLRPVWICVLLLIFAWARPAAAQQTLAEAPDLKLRTVGTVRHVAILPNDQIVIAGDFTEVDGVPRAGLARLNPNGSLDATWDPNPDERVFALCVVGDSLLVGGRFSSIAGAGQKGVAKFDLKRNGEFDETWRPALLPATAGDTVFISEVIAYGDDVYLGGFFATAGGQPHANLVRLSSLGTGRVDHRWHPQVEDSVATFAIDGKYLYIGSGSFDSVGKVNGFDVGTLARITMSGTGTVDRKWTPRPTTTLIPANEPTTTIPASIDSIVPLNGSIYVSGQFTKVNGISRPCLAKVDTVKGTLDPAWAPAASLLFSSTTNLGGGAVTRGSRTTFAARPLVPAGDGLYLCGGLGVTTTTVYTLFAKLNLSSGAVQAESDTVFDVTRSGVAGVAAAAIRGNRLVAVGNFERVRGQSTFGVAALILPDATIDPNFHASVLADGHVFALEAQPDGKVLFGGDFVVAGGLPREHLGRINADGTLDLSWNPGADGNVLSIAVVNSQIFVGGAFFEVGGQPRQCLAKFASTGNDAVDPAWQADCDGQVEHVVGSGSSIFAGGKFKHVQGLSRFLFAKLSTSGNGAVDAFWNPVVANGYVVPPDSMLLAGNQLYVGGVQLIRLSTSGNGTMDPNWQPLFQGASGFVSVNSLALTGSDIYAAGVFNSVNFVSRANLVKLSAGATATVDSSWNPKITGSYGYFFGAPSALAISGQNLYVAGNFQGIGGLSRFGLVKMSRSGTATVDPDWHEFVFLQSVGAMVLRGDDLLVGAYNFSENGVSNTFALVPTANQPFLFSDPADANKVFLRPSEMDGAEIAYFQMNAEGGSLFTATNREVMPGDFVTTAEGAAGLRFEAFSGAGATTVSARASVRPYVIGTGDDIASLTIGAAASQALFDFGQASFQVMESAGMFSLVVRNGSGMAGDVAYTIEEGTARSGRDFSATSLTGTLSFTQGQAQQTIPITLLANGVYTGDRSFTVRLQPAGAGNASLGLNPTAVVTILDSDPVPGYTDSQLDATAVTSAGPATGELQIDLFPATARGGWRLLGEQVWRDGSTKAVGLTEGNYEIQFKPVNGYRAPQPAVEVVKAGTPAADSFSYTSQATTLASGKLHVSIKPALVALATDPASRGQWRLQGEGDNAWRDGEAEQELGAGLYVVEFKPVASYATPPLQVQVVGRNQTSNASGGYLNAPPDAGAGPARLSTAQVTSEAPYRYCGQVYSEIGLGSGWVTDARTVLTAAHVVFDDESLSFATETRWLFERSAGESEAPPLKPYGTYVLAGYAQQRQSDRDAGVAPGEATPESRQLDAAVLYFVDTPAARGGRGGFLFTHQIDSEWLLASRQKMLIGYPGATAPGLENGALYATDRNVSVSFQRRNGQVYTTTDLRGYPGMSGGPLVIQADNGNFYAAAVYLGGNGQSVVRAIDADVVDLINRGERSAAGGGNFVGGGVPLLSANFGSSSYGIGYLRVFLSPPAALTAGASWRVTAMEDFQGSGSKLPLVGREYQVEFTAVPGYAQPPRQNVTVTSFQTTDLVVSYDRVYTIHTSPEPSDFGTTTETQGIAGEEVTVIARPGPDNSFSYWSDTATGQSVSTAARYRFVADGNRTLQAHFIPGPFKPYKGRYAGLLLDARGDRALGTVSVTVTGSGHLSGSIRMGAQTMAVHGELAPDGTFHAKVGAGAHSFDLTLELNAEDGVFLVETHLFQAGELYASGEPELGISAAEATHFTLLLEHAPAPGTPPGAGFGTGSVSAKGHFQCAGSLSDGTKWSAAGQQTRSGMLPILARLYGGRGALSGLAKVTTAASAVLAGDLNWSKPARLKDGYYPAGFSLLLSLQGAAYAKPSGFENTSVTLTLADGGFFDTLRTLDVSLDDFAKGTAGDVTLSIDAKSGLVKGSFAAPVSGKKTAFLGAVLKTPFRGAGFFLGSGGNAGGVGVQMSH